MSIGPTSSFLVFLVSVFFPSSPLVQSSKDSRVLGHVLSDTNTSRCLLLTYACLLHLIYFRISAGAIQMHHEFYLALLGLYDLLLLNSILSGPIGDQLLRHDLTDRS